MTIRNGTDLCVIAVMSLSVSTDLDQISSVVVELDATNEDITSASISTKSPSSFTRSSCWKHFKDIIPSVTHPHHAICIHCNTILLVGKSRSPTTLQRHLERSHKELLKPADPVPGGLDPFVEKNPCLTDATLKWIVMTHKPLSEVTDPYFSAMLIAVSPKVKHISRKCLQKRLGEVYGFVKSKLPDLFRGENVSLTTDGWKSIASQRFVSLKCHWINNDWEVKSAAIDAQVLPGNHTASQLAKKLIEMAEGVGLTPHSGLVKAVTIDTTATMLAAGRLLPFEYMGCFDHLIQLSAKIFFDGPGVEEAMAQAWGFVAHFSPSALEEESLLAFQRRRQDGNGKVLKLLQDVTTRWWSTFTMLERLMELKPTLQAMKLMEETSVELSPETWEIIRLGSIVLKPFKAVQLMMEGEKYITLSLVPVLVKGLRDGLREKLSGMKEVDADPEITASAREKVLETLDAMLADINSRWGMMHLSN